MYDETGTGAAGMDRREMLRRSAIVGGAGALMWAAPSVTKFAPRAFGTEGTPIFGGWSFFAAVVRCTKADGSVMTYGIKANLEGGAVVWETGDSLTPFCTPPDGWAGATKILGSDPKLAAKVTQSGDILKVCITADAPGCTFTYDGAVGVVKESTNCANEYKVSDDGRCVEFDVSVVAAN
jgi:hypothetical protein